ncbi:MAG: hypothetical protein HeimC2_08020 [Candidatus Heimdallarchaeota archaeon LC_2]|nr:MAG: hypothetical protein HeimC2_08020 [Candidatus Heimdallarchaeota archaeon LC_2]
MQVDFALHLLTLILFAFYSLITSIYFLYFYPSFLRGVKKFENTISDNEFDEIIANTKDIPTFIVQITTKGGEMGVIIEGLSKLEVALNRLKEIIRSKIIIDILTENPDDLEQLKLSNIRLNCNFYVVPNNYETNNSTKLKARALHYMINIREKLSRKNQINFKNQYIIHFDAESTINYDGLITIIGSVIQNPHKTIFQGPIFYTNNWFKSKIYSRQMESLRPWNCYECFSSTKNGLPYHLHGSNIVVRADIEHDVGWDFGLIKGYPVVAEDLVFGIKAYLKYGKSIFGWHGAKMLEQPAFTLNDSVKQRVRWIRGSLQSIDLINKWSEYETSISPNKNLISLRIRIKLYFYALGFIPSLISVFGIFYFASTITKGAVARNSVSEIYENTSHQTKELIMPMVPGWLVTISLIGAVMWLISIQIGLYHNIKSSNIGRIQKIREHIVILLITPFATLIDTGIAFFTILKWSLGFNKAVWDVTPKLLQT